MEAPRVIPRSFGQKVISYLAENKDANDVTFIVGSTGEEIFALKVALQAACPALDELFKHNWHKYWEKGNLRVPLPDVNPAAFRIFLKILLWDVVEAEEVQRLNVSTETSLHLVKISKKLRMAEINKLFSTHIKIQGQDDELSTADEYHSFDLKVRNRNQEPGTRNTYASGQYSSTTGVHTEGSMSVAGNVITVIGTSAHVPKFVPPVTHFYEIDPPTPSFTGRSNILTTIHSRMKACSGNISCIDRIDVLCGLGGIGKTEIARMYAKEYKLETFTKNVAWINAENFICLQRSFHSLALILNVSGNQTNDLNATVGLVYKHFSEHIGNGLFIFDNAPQFNDIDFQIFKYFPTSESLKRRPMILITSREQDWDIPPENIIQVHELTNKESVALFTKKLKLRLDQQSFNNQTAILKLAECFKGFPLGLSLAASNIDYVDELDLEDEIEEYLKRMEMPQGGWGDDTQSGAATKYSLVIKNVWEITLKKIEAKERDGGDAIKLLNLMAFCPAENMTVAFMSEMFEFVFSKSVTTTSFAILQKKSMISIETLSVSLATTVKRNAATIQKIIKIHKLVQQCIRDNLKEDDAYFVLTRICNYVSNVKLNNDTSYIKNALICAHNHLKIRKWPQDSICCSVIFCSLMTFFENQNVDILFELVKDVYSNLGIKEMKLVDMQTKDKAINLFCMCLVWINKHNDIDAGYETLLNNQTLRKENFDNVVNSFERHGSQSEIHKTNNMELHVLQNYLYNHCYDTLYTLMAAEKEKRILNATSKAVLKYRAIMETVMDDEYFKSDDILEQASELAKRNAIDLYNFSCKPTGGDKLTLQRAELTQKIGIILREFQNSNNHKKAKAEKVLRAEAANCCQSYVHRFETAKEYPFLSDDQIEQLHTEITFTVTQKFTERHLDSPLLDFALLQLTRQLNEERQAVHQTIKQECRKVLDSADTVSAQALDCYKQIIQNEFCGSLSELSDLHRDAKKASLEILQKFNKMPQKILVEQFTALDTQINIVYMQALCSLDKQESSVYSKFTSTMDIASVSTPPSSYAIGIDFGTNFCRAAILQYSHKDIEILQSDFIQISIPSYVSYVFNQVEGQTKELHIFAGETAKELASVNPQNTIFDIKCLIGRRFEDPYIQKHKQLWPFHLVNMTGHVGVKIGDEEKLPQVIASELLSHLKKTSEGLLRSPIDCTVVTIPTYYSKTQKDLTEWACHAAGFRNIHFIAVPVAAAAAYGIRYLFPSYEAKTCLIYDLGGGTFDVTILRLDAKNRVEVKATGGGDRLAGKDYNDILTEFCINEFKRIHGINLTEGQTSEDREVCKKTARKLRRIRNECEVQKCCLSSATMTSVVVSLNNIYEDIDLLVKVTRSKFEELIQSLLNQSIEILSKTVKKSGYKKNKIDFVILIGGSSRIPKVQQMVQEYFAGNQICRTIDADEAVARGAALHAYNVFEVNGQSFSVVAFLEKMQLRLQSIKAAVSLPLRAAESLSETIRWGNKINGFPPRSEHAAVAVGNVIYSFGGKGKYRDPSHSDDVLDVFVLNVKEQKNGWEKLSAENSAVNPNHRFGHSAVTHKQFVLIFGGHNTKKSHVSNSTYRFNTLTLKWDKPKVKGNIPDARCDHSAVVLRKQMFVYGGREKGMTNNLHSLHLESFCWSTIQTKGIPPSLREGHSATVHDDRCILIFGGFDYEKEKTVNAIWSFDVNNKTWTAMETSGTPPLNQRDHCAFVRSGRMYIFGGRNYPSYFNEVFSYDPETFKWRQVTTIGEAPSRRFCAKCVAVNDQVLIFGGDDGKYCNDTHVLQM